MVSRKMSLLPSPSDVSGYLLVSKCPNLDDNYILTKYRITGKFGQEVLQIYFSAKNVWQINRAAKRLLVISTNLDYFSLANHG